MCAMPIQWCVRSGAALTLACGFVGMVSAQEYTCELLYRLNAPSPITVYSYREISPGGSVGSGWGPGTSGVPHAIYIPASTGTPVDLHPASGYTDTYALACMHNQQVGYGWHLASSRYQAIMWTGSAASIVNLNPSGFLVSEASGTDGTFQVGWAGTTVQQNAILWEGSAASATVLHPEGYHSSVALEVSDGKQIGSGWPVSGSVTHALLWSGTAASVVDLHPAGYSTSSGQGLGGSQQVGSGVISGATHALLWHGTAASAVDLHPPGHSRSIALATNGLVQVGEATPTGGNFRAIAWSGSADSHVSLHALLPTDTAWASSRAMSVDEDGVIYGFAYGVFTGGPTYYWAVRWTPVDGCIADYNGAGDEGDILDFLDFFDDFGACEGQPGPCGSVADADVNGDTIVDILDFLDFLDGFGTGC